MNAFLYIVYLGIYTPKRFSSSYFKRPPRNDDLCGPTPRDLDLDLGTSAPHASTSPTQMIRKQFFSRILSIEPVITARLRLLLSLDEDSYRKVREWQALN